MLAGGLHAAIGSALSAEVHKLLFAEYSSALVIQLEVYGLTGVVLCRWTD